MRDRPPIGTRVRVLGNSGLKRRDLGAGTVCAHYPDGVAMRVQLDDGREVAVDPVNVEPEAAHV